MDGGEIIDGDLTQLDHTSSAIPIDASSHLSDLEIQLSVPNPPKNLRQSFHMLSYGRCRPVQGCGSRV